MNNGTAPEPALPDAIVSEIQAHRATTRLGVAFPPGGWDAETWACALSIKSGQAAMAAMRWQQPDSTGNEPVLGRHEFRVLMVQSIATALDALEVLDLHTLHKS